MPIAQIKDLSKVGCVGFDPSSLLGLEIQTWFYFRTKFNALAKIVESSFGC